MAASSQPTSYAATAVLASMAAVSMLQVAPVTAASPPQRRRMPYLKEKDIQELMGSSINYDPSQTKDSWVSVTEDVEFLPLLNANKNMKHGKNKKTTKNRRKARTLEEVVEDDLSTSGAYTNYNPFSVQPFIEGMGEYDEYQQAWRLLGFMIDCNEIMFDDDYVASGGSGDEVTDEGCARYVLWAAYVDLEYEGGGIGEYQYYNRTSGSWDDTACYYADGSGHSGGSGDNNDGDGDYGDYNSRCAKMDCHEEDTNFSVLGFFKHRNYDDWMEQLFKHEGMCVWSEEEYAFMKNARKAWPKGCSDTGTTVDGSDGYSANLYYNIKPLRNGRIAVGLYTDEQCVKEYPADSDYVESIVGNVFLNANSHNSNDNADYDFSSDSLSESMDRWDSAFDVWHMCHPCVAHDLENTGGNKYTDDDDGYYNDDGGADDGANRRQRKKRKLGGEYSAQGDVFECYDDAGYTNVNQCMKFSAKTVMKTATFRDLSLGRNQGSLVEYPLSGYFDASQQYRRQTMGNVATYFFLVAAAAALVLSLWNLYKVSKQARRSNVGVAANSDSLLV